MGQLTSRHNLEGQPAARHYQICTDDQERQWGSEARAHAAAGVGA